MSQQFVHAHDSSRGHQDTIWALQWTTAEQCLSAGADGRLLLWDTTKANDPPAREFQQHPLALISLSGNTEGTRVLSNSIEGTTSLYDVQTGELLGKHESFERRAGIASEPAWSVSLNPNGATYAASNTSGSVTIHSTDKESFGNLVQTLSSGRSKFGLSVAHSPDAKRIALSSETGAIYIFDIESATLTATFSSHAMSVRALGWSPDSQLLLSASDDKRLVLHDVRTSAGGKPGSGAVASLNGHSSWVLSASIATDGRAAISGSSDRTIKIWDLSQRSCVSTLQEQDEVWGVCWKPTSGFGAGSFASSGEGCVRFWRSAGTG